MKAKRAAIGCAGITIEGHCYMETEFSHEGAFQHIS